MIIEVLVKPGSKKGPLVVEEGENLYTVFIREKPHDGEANDALIKLLSDYFDVPKTSINIKSGVRGHRKIVELD